MSQHTSTSKNLHCLKSFSPDMPVLNWIGMGVMVRHDADVPFRLLRHSKTLPCGWARATEVVSMHATLPSMMA